MINLYELANAELEDSRQKEMTEHSKSRDLQHEFGLQTLLEFQEDDSILSSVYPGCVTLSDRNNLTEEIKAEIEFMRAKRQQLCRKWETIPKDTPINSKNKKSVYQLILLANPLSNRFEAQLKANIQREKSFKLSSLVMKILMRRFMNQLNKYSDLTKFMIKRESVCKTIVFNSWRKVINGRRDKQKLLQAIRNRIAQRVRTQILDHNKSTNNLQ